MYIFGSMKLKFYILYIVYFFQMHFVFSEAKDSLSFSKFHVGVGFFSGVQTIAFDYAGTNYYHFGFDAGILTKVGYEFSKKYELYAHFRIRDNNASVLYAGYTTEYYSIANQTGLLLHRTFFNSKTNNLFTLYGGLNYVWSRNTLYYSIDPRQIPPYPIWSPYTTTYMNETFNEQFYTTIVGISKSIPLWKRLEFNFFAEFEYGLNDLDWTELQYIRPYPDILPVYRPFIWRMGFCVIY